MSVGWSAKKWETTQGKMAPPAEPTAPPMPTTVETEVEGNMSVGVEKRLADQPWWAAVASAKRAMAGQALVGKSVCMCGTSMMGRTAKAQTVRANLRPALTLWPRFIQLPESQPPAME